MMSVRSNVTPNAFQTSLATTTAYWFLTRALRDVSKTSTMNYGPNSPFSFSLDRLRKLGLLLIGHASPLAVIVGQLGECW